MAAAAGGRALDFTGTDRKDTIVGTEDDDVIRGLASNDRLEGRGGDDLVDGGLGFDVLYGDAGDDTLQGGDHDDTLFGGDDDDRLEGGEGDDRLVDVTGRSTILGGGGHDDVAVLDGGDWVEGGDGGDDIQVEAKHAQGETTVLAGAGSDYVQLRHIGFSAFVSLGKGNDLIHVNDGDAYTVMGGSGDDHVRGGPAVDLERLVAWSGVGDDELDMAMWRGTEGLRVADAGAGADVVAVGGYGKTRVTLGEGADRVSFNHVALAAVLPERVVRIADFQAGDGGDELRVDALFHGFYDDGNPYNGEEWTPPGDLFEHGLMRLVDDGTTTFVEVDFDGAEAAYGWTRIVAMAGVDAGDLTAANFHGYDPDLG